MRTKIVDFNNALTNRERVLAYLRLHGTMTPMRAMTEYGETRLAARIEELRREGWDIRSRTCHALNGKKYFEYTLSTTQCANDTSPLYGATAGGQPKYLRWAA